MQSMPWHDHILMPAGGKVENLVTQPQHLNLIHRPGFGTPNERILVDSHMEAQHGYITSSKIAYGATIPDAPRFEIHRGNLGVGRMHYGTSGAGSSPMGPPSHYPSYPTPVTGELQKGILGGEMGPVGVPPGGYPTFSQFAQPGGGGKLYFSYY